MVSFWSSGALVVTSVTGLLFPGCHLLLWSCQHCLSVLALEAISGLQTRDETSFLLTLCNNGPEMDLCTSTCSVTPAPLMRSLNYHGNYIMEQGRSVLGYFFFFQMILLTVYRQVSLKSSLWSLSIKKLSEMSLAAPTGTGPLSRFTSSMMLIKGWFFPTSDWLAIMRSACYTFPA